MNREKIQELIAWLYVELERASKEAREAREKRAFGIEAQSQGRADAILRIIKKLENEYAVLGNQP